MSGSSANRAQAGQPYWWRQLQHRFAVLTWVKAFGTCAFMVFFFWAYFSLLRHPVFPVRVMPLTAIDHWVPFTAAALPFYLSLWVYVSLPPALLRTLPELLRFGAHVGTLCLAGVLCFLLWPTAVPVNDPAWARDAGTLFIDRVDMAGNACPSLHVASAVFSALWLAQLLREVGAPRWASIGNGVWCAAIIYSTLAVRQHVFLDVAAGIMLGSAFGLASLALRRRIAKREDQDDEW